MNLFSKSDEGNGDADATHFRKALTNISSTTSGMGCSERDAERDNFSLALGSSLASEQRNVEEIMKKALTALESMKELSIALRRYREHLEASRTSFFEKGTIMSDSLRGKS